MKKEIKLNVAISALVLLVVLIATLIELVSSTNALKTSLTTNYLNNNYIYTNKLAEAITYVTSDLQKSMVAMAKLSSYPDFDQNRLDILFESENQHFNSIFITDRNGIIQLMSPRLIEFKDRETVVRVQAGQKIATDIVNQVLSTEKPYISQPYISASGTLLILVAAPVVNGSDVVEGVMAGTIYLQDENTIKTVFGSNKYTDGSFVFAVDRNGRIIYHPNSNRIFEDVNQYGTVKKVLSGESCYDKVKDEEGTEYFAGYSFIENMEWGVILLTPTSILKEPLFNLVNKIMAQSMLILFFLLLAAAFFVKRLTNPLTKLATYSERLILNKKISNDNDELNINSKIYEINQLDRQLKIQLLKLNQEIQLDGLTGVANRKTFDARIAEWTEQQQPFSLIMLDIDNFKNINDTYGHLIGDEVIQFLATILNSFTEEGELCFRYGGEEFGLLLKEKNETEAAVIAEQFRLKIASMQTPTGKPITVSVGITALKENDDTPKTIIERADKALYQSKQGGENRVTVYGD